MSQQSVSTNLLKRAFEKYKTGLLNEDPSIVPQGLSDAEKTGLAFEYFCAETLFKKDGLSTSMSRDIVVGGRGDRKIDGVAVFLDGVYVSENTSFDANEEEEAGSERSTVEQIKRKYDHEMIRNVDSRLRIEIFQAKVGKGNGKQDIPVALRGAMRELLSHDNYNSGYQKLAETYSANLLERFQFIFDIIYELEVYDIELKFHICGINDESKFVGMTKGEYEALAEDIREVFTEAKVEIERVNSSKLFELWRWSDDCNSVLESVAKLEHDDQYIFLCSIRSFVKFITDEVGNLRTALFDGNIRGFLGERKENNSAILESLRSNRSDRIPFWFLNNGVTVICNSIPTQAGNRWSLNGVQIVNGLQTSHMIYKYWTECANQDSYAENSLRGFDDNFVTVKVIFSTDIDLVNRVIRATNTQSPVNAASLRATDVIQRNIEEYFRLQDDGKIIYDRRQGHAAASGLAASSEVIQINELAQAVLATLRCRPDTARARPGTAIKSDEEYKKIFNENTDLKLYYWSAKTYIGVRNALVQMKRADSNNVMFYVLAVLSAVASDSLGLNDREPLGLFSPGARSLKQKDWNLVPDVTVNFGRDEILQLANEVLHSLDAKSKAEGLDPAQLAKGSAFKWFLFSRLRDRRTSLGKSVEALAGNIGQSR